MHKIKKSNQTSILKILISILASVFLLINSFYIAPAAAVTPNSNSTKKQATLENKIASGYSSKFCNAIGIGMSFDSALKMSVAENTSASYNPSLWIELLVSGDEEIDKVKKEDIALLISEKVVEKCGYPIGLSGDEGIKNFSEVLLLELIKS